MSNINRWKVPEYSKSQIIQAGKIIKNPSASPEEFMNALKVIDNWRASHAYPLHIIYCNLRRNYNKNGYIVAQRLKRLDSIVIKLNREPTMSLWTMQDLGGCRLIVPSVKDVYDAVDKYKGSRVRHILIREYDYIKQPKISGYRSYHLVYKYQSDTKDTYNRNMLIEIQIRSKIQHLWATAVETMGLFTNQALKASCGEEDTLRFFALISSLFAQMEDTPIIPGTPDQSEDIINELKQLNSKHNYLNMLSAIRVAVDHVEEQNKNRQGYYILILDYKEMRLWLRFYKPSEIDKATEDYNRIESNRKENQIDAVLVSVSSFSALRAAYPNYFSDIKAFVSAVNKIFKRSRNG